MQDLETVRRWRRGTSRVIVWHGYEGAAGVTLIRVESEQRYRASFGSVQAAAVAIAADRISWKVTAGPIEPGDDMRQSNARRRGARASHKPTARR